MFDGDGLVDLFMSILAHLTRLVHDNHTHMINVSLTDYLFKEIYNWFYFYH